MFGILSKSIEKPYQVKNYTIYNAYNNEKLVDNYMLTRFLNFVLNSETRDLKCLKYEKNVLTAFILTLFNIMIFSDKYISKCEIKS